LIAARAPASRDTVGRDRSACRKADIEHGPLRVKSVGWAVGSGNVAPTAGLEQVGRQQAAKGSQW
jgi:hypothetical protein